MKRAGLLVLGLLALAADGPRARAEGAAPAPSSAGLAEHADKVVEYVLKASLDPSKHTVHAEGTIAWRNTSDKAVSELWLHLYLNAFKNQRSNFMRAPIGG